MEPKETPAFWAVIPAAVRYDKHLPPNAKLLYGEVTAMSDKLGYCYAQNSYFAKLFGMSERSVTRLLSTLVERGYLRIDVLRDAGTQAVLERRIFAVYNTAAGVRQPPDNFVGTPPDTDDGTPPDKNGGENNTRYDRISPLPPKGAGKAKKDQLDPDVRAILTSYTGETGPLKEAMDTLMEVRIAKEAVNTPRAIRTLLNELDRLSGGDLELKLRVVRQSITNSWKSVFPLKGGQAPPSKAEDEQYDIE